MDGSDENPEPPESPGSPRATSAAGTRSAPRLSGRTVAVCVCVALVAAVGAGLVASIVVGRDRGATTSETADGVTFRPVAQVDPVALRSVELLTVDGAKTSLRPYLGLRPTVINLWAQSCAPCIKEMPWLEQASRDNPQVAFLGVNMLDRLDNARAMATRTGITYPWVRDPTGDFGNAAQATGLPVTLLLDTRGRVVASKLGAFRSQGSVQRWLEDHLP